MLEGPFRKDRKFIRFCNQNIIHIVYLQGPKKETVKIKEDGLLEERCKWVPQLTPAQINEVGQDVIEELRDKKAPSKWRCPRFEIWSADRKPLVIHEAPSQFIPSKVILKAIKEAQKKLGPFMTRKLYGKAEGLLHRVDQAMKGERNDEARKVLKILARIKGLTPAFLAEVKERQDRLLPES